MTKPNNCIFFLEESGRVVPVKWNRYQRFIDCEAGVEFPEYAGQRIKTAQIGVEMDNRVLKNISTVEFRYTDFDPRGGLDMEAVRNFIREGQAVAEADAVDGLAGEYRRRYFWEPSEDQFKSLMRLALKPSLDYGRTYGVASYPSMSRDHSDSVIDGMCKMIDTFPGLRVVGNNFSLDSANVTFDVTHREGLISALFLTQAGKLPMIEDVNLSLYAPENDMRFVLEFPRAEDPKKVSVWVVAVYQKLLAYRDAKKGN